MGQAISGEDALDGANGGQWSNPFPLQDLVNGLRSTREAPVIEMESFHYNDLFYLFKSILVHGVTFKVT